MLKFLLVLTLFFGMRIANAQTYAFIDSDYILKSVPEYVEAKDKLDKMAERWTKEIEERYTVIKTKKSNFEREEVLLPAEEKAKRKAEIEKLDNQLEELEMVRYRMESEGFHYCFKHYSSFQEVEDMEFHRLRKKYLDVSEQLENYVSNKIEELNDKINSINDEELN